MGYIDDEITGQKLSAYEVIQNLSSKEAGLIKFIPFTELRGSANTIFEK